MGVLGAHSAPDGIDLNISNMTATMDLDVLAAARQDADVLGMIPTGAQVLATDQVRGDYRQVRFEGNDGWVSDAGLTN